MIGALAVTSVAAIAAPGDIDISNQALDSSNSSTGFMSTQTFDPLRTVPPMLSNGIILPGDAAPLPCPNASIHPDVEGNPKPLGLIDAIDIALCTNPQLKSSWAAIKVQAAALGEAKAAYLPTASAELSHVDDRTTYPGAGLPVQTLRDDEKTLGLNWRLFDFGSRAANKQVATDLLGAAMASHDAAIQKVLETVIGAYFDAQTAQATWDARIKSEQVAAHTLAIIQRRQDHGAASQADTLQAATALARASLDKSRAAGDLQKALSVLVYCLGRPAGTQLTLAPDLADDNTQSRRELSEWLAQAQQQHPAILAARAQLDAARNKVKATQSDGLPTVDFSANYYQNGRPNLGLPTMHTNETVLAVTLTIPLFEGFGRTYKVRGALAQVEQKSADLADIEHQILMDVVKTHADAVSALGNLDASKLLLQTAQSATESVQRKLDRGVADVLEMLNVQAALTDAQLQRIRCLAEWQSARLRLMAVAGTLGRESLGISH